MSTEKRNESKKELQYYADIKKVIDKITCLIVPLIIGDYEIVVTRNGISIFFDERQWRKIEVQMNYKWDNSSPFNHTFENIRLIMGGMVTSDDNEALVMATYMGHLATVIQQKSHFYTKIISLYNELYELDYELSKHRSHISALQNKLKAMQKDYQWDQIKENMFKVGQIYDRGNISPNGGHIYVEVAGIKKDKIGLIEHKEFRSYDNPDKMIIHSKDRKTWLLLSEVKNKILNNSWKVCEEVPQSFINTPLIDV